MFGALAAPAIHATEQRETAAAVAKRDHMFSRAELAPGATQTGYLLFESPRDLPEFADLRLELKSGDPPAPGVVVLNSRIPIESDCARQERGNVMECMQYKARTLVLFASILLMQGCATAHVKVRQEGTVAPQKFDRLAVPPFENGVGAGLPMTAPDDVAGAVIAKMQKAYPGAFAEVGSRSTGQPGELVVNGKITSYNPGSKAARFILIGLGAGDLKLEVNLTDAASGSSLEQFTTDGAIAAGGLVGASMGMEDMIESAAAKVAERLARYGGSP